MDYHKLLLDELRFVTYRKSNTELTDELLAKAVTMNENLQTLGYVLSPVDIVTIATSPSLDGFYEKIRGMIDSVKAEPSEDMHFRTLFYPGDLLRASPFEAGHAVPRGLVHHVTLPVPEGAGRGEGEPDKGRVLQPDVPGRAHRPDELYPVELCKHVL